MHITFAIFLFCAIYLGEVFDFYFRIPNWDTMLHVFSGFALGAIGFSIIGLVNKSDSVPASLSPAFVAIFAFCFAVALGALWEIFEFSADTIAGLNMQKHTLETGEMLVGRAALADTMKDLIVDSLGALVMSVVGYVSVKREAGWLERMQIKINRPVLAPEPTPVPAPVPVPVYAIHKQVPFAPAKQPIISVSESLLSAEQLRTAV